MIKHGKIHKLKNVGRPNSHLQPIMNLVTKGVADAKESIELQPKACDVKGAKRFNGQQCVIARAFSRTHHPQAVAIGRSLAFAVFDGLAIRFTVPPESRRLIEEFDQRGKSSLAPIRLAAVNKTWRLDAKRSQANVNFGSGNAKKKSRTRKYGIRAIGGGVAA